MNIRIKMLFACAISLGLMTSMNPASAEGYRKDIKFNFDDQVQNLLKQYTIAVNDTNKTTSPDPVAEAIGSCVSGLKDVGLQLSSMLVTPTGAGGAGPKARSLSPDEIKSEICTEYEANGDSIKVCIRTKN